jgi:hypothetical protein
MSYSTAERKKDKRIAELEYQLKITRAVLFDERRHHDTAFNLLSDLKSKIMNDKRELERDVRELAERNNELNVKINQLSIQTTIGKKVNKVSGYRYPGEVVAVFNNKAGETRFVVEATGEEYAGMLHIFNQNQLSFIDNND